MKDLVVILRLYALPASVIPAVLGGLAAWRGGFFSPGDTALAALGAALVHCGANLANTYFDFKKGVDRPETADDRAILDGLISEKAALLLTLALLAAGGGIGILLAWKNNVPGLLRLGALGMALAWFYTAGPGYKYKALGDLGIFLAFGPFITAGTAMAISGSILNEALLISLPPGLLIVAILHANNARDLKADGDAGFRTVAGLLGPERSKTYYSGLLAGAYATAMIMGPAALPTLLSIPAALRLHRAAKAGDFAPLVRSTPRFVGLFGLLFAAGLAVTR